MKTRKIIHGKYSKWIKLHSGGVIEISILFERKTVEFILLLFISPKIILYIFTKNTYTITVASDFDNSNVILKDRKINNYHAFVLCFSCICVCMHFDSLWHFDVASCFSQSITWSPNLFTSVLWSHWSNIICRCHFLKKVNN